MSANLSVVGRRRYRFRARFAGDVTKAPRTGDWPTRPVRPTLDVDRRRRRSSPPPQALSRGSRVRRPCNRRILFDKPTRALAVHCSPRQVSTADDRLPLSRRQRRRRVIAPTPFRRCRPGLPAVVSATTRAHERPPSHNYRRRAPP